MDNVQLELFIDTVNLGSFSKCAKKRYLTTPVVKRRIDALEAEVGASFLVRGPRGVIPTDTGRAVYDAASNIVASWNACLDDVCETGGGKIIRVAMHPLIHDKDWQSIIASYENVHPNCQVILVPTPSTEYIESVENNVCDVCNIPALVDVSGRFVDPTPFSYEEHVVALVATDHPLTTRIPCTIEDIRRFPIATSYLLRPSIAELFCIPQKEVARFRFDGSDFRKISRFMEDGGVCLVTSVAAEFLSNCATIPLGSDAPSMRLHMVIRVDAPEHIVDFARFVSDFRSRHAMD